MPLAFTRCECKVSAALCVFFLTQRRQRERHMRGGGGEGTKNPACKIVRGIVWRVIIPPSLLPLCYCMATVQCRVRGQGEETQHSPPAAAAAATAAAAADVVVQPERVNRSTQIIFNRPVSRCETLNLGNSCTTLCLFFCNPPNPSSLVSSRLAGLIILSAAIRRQSVLKHTSRQIKSTLPK